MGLCVSLLTACGGAHTDNNSDVFALNEPYANTQQQVTITPALAPLASEDHPKLPPLVLEHLAISLQEIRLVGADPRIPSGGIPLLEESRVITWDHQSETAAGVEVSLPIVAGPDAALFVRIGSSIHLDGASVEISGELYKQSDDVTLPTLSATLHKPETSSPAEAAAESAPLHGQIIRGSLQIEEGQIQLLELTLQEHNTIDLMLPIGAHDGPIEAVIRVPVERWFNPVVNQALSSPSSELPLTLEDNSWHFQLDADSEGADETGTYQLNLVSP